jgi:hypothetical protein
MVIQKRIKASETLISTGDLITGVYNFANLYG